MVYCKKDKFIISEEFVESVKARKENFTLYSLDGISLSKIQLLFKEIAGSQSNTRRIKILKPNRLIKKPRFGGIVMTKEDKAIEEEKNEQLFFTSDSLYVDYIELRNTIDHIYDVFGFHL